MEEMLRQLLVAISAGQGVAESLITGADPLEYVQGLLQKTFVCMTPDVLPPKGVLSFKQQSAQMEVCSVQSASVGQNKYSVGWTLSR